MHLIVPYVDHKFHKVYHNEQMHIFLNKQYQDGPSNIASQTAATENVAAEALPDGLKNALNKDYSELVSRFETRK